MKEEGCGQAKKSILCHGEGPPGMCLPQLQKGNVWHMNRENRSETGMVPTEEIWAAGRWQGAGKWRDGVR